MTTRMDFIIAFNCTICAEYRERLGLSHFSDAETEVDYLFYPQTLENYYYLRLLDKTRYQTAPGYMYTV